ncbi:Hypothetical protein, putative [Bodo saltans]|uniref:Uncharacterized protein n=1 Tax=Bodo saltans TaxID=75058 RepID=A0A0S4JAM0_BODSA|nr:Hypothetical protein, putative [Bodo saltans]|eukprot:CUG87039.1 Hypothetical protein, putative [Bodo saltans]
MGTTMCTCSFEEPTMSPRHSRSNNTSVISNGGKGGNENENSFSLKVMRNSAKRSHTPTTSPLLRRNHSTSFLLSGDATTAAPSVQGQSRNSTATVSTGRQSRSSAQPLTANDATTTTGSANNPLEPSAHRRQLRGEQHQLNCFAAAVLLPPSGEQAVEEPEDIEAPFTPLQMPPLILATFPTFLNDSAAAA